jgi:LPS export ABC transporter protein LptC
VADRRRRIKLALAGIIIVALAAVIWSFARFRAGQTALQRAVPEVASKAVMALSKVHQTATRDGVIQWEMDAESAELEAKTGRMILNAPEVEFLMQDGTRVHLSARRGILDTESNDIQVQGNVSLTNDRYTLTTETLSYRHAERLLMSDRPVKIVGDAMRLQATAMTYDLNTNRAQFGGRVKGMVDDDIAL